MKVDSKRLFRILEIITGYLLIIPAVMVVYSLLTLDTANMSFWDKYFFSFFEVGGTYLARPRDWQSIDFIIIAMTFTGGYLIKSKSD